MTDRTDPIEEAMRAKSYPVDDIGDVVDLADATRVALHLVAAEKEKGEQLRRQIEWRDDQIEMLRAKADADAERRIAIVEEQRDMRISVAGTAFENQQRFGDVDAMGRYAHKRYIEGVRSVAAAIIAALRSELSPPTTPETSSVDLGGKTLRGDELAQALIDADAPSPSPQPEESEPERTVVDLMEALERSVQEAKAARQRHSSPPSPSPTPNEKP